MAKRTIFISEDHPLSQVIACCPLAIRILERHLGREIFKRDDLDRISLKVR
jgi:hypothetical protein